MDENLLAATHTFEAVKLTLSQGPQGWVLALRIHPNDVEALKEDKPGARYMGALTRLDDYDQPDINEEYLRAKRRVEQAGLLCRRDDFYLHMAEVIGHLDPPPYTEQTCAEMLRLYLGVSSRADLHHSPVAAANFDQLVHSYESAKLRGEI